jgi:hypothetical protein
MIALANALEAAQKFRGETRDLKMNYERRKMKTNPLGRHVTSFRFHPSVFAGMSLSQQLLKIVLAGFKIVPDPEGLA